MSSRFTMVLAAAAGAGMLFSLGTMFGLGLLAPPEKIQANGPSPYLARMQAENDKARGAEDERALTPIYPTSPKVAGADDAATKQSPATARQDAPATQQTAAANTAPQLPRPAPDQTASAVVAPPPAATAAAPQPAQPNPQPAQPPAPSPTVAAAAETTGTAPVDDVKATPTPAPEPAAPAALAATESVNKCDVAACAAAYRSFRASDCTYQPFDGPRRLCTGPSPEQRQASKPREPKSQDAAISARSRAGDRGDLDDVEAAVRRLTRDGDGFYPPPSMRDDSRRMIVIDRW